MNKFRKLRADEIECRVSQINEKGLTLLLYKDARCDMNMLDEIVGPENWSCRYSEHKGTLFCEVGLFTADGWVWKEDAGAPSNMESQKGEASDAFKRACFRWGIGRELYTAPFIWVPAGNYTAYQKNGKYQTYDRFEATSIGYEGDAISKNGKYQTYDRFEVTSIGYEGDAISQLTIANQKTHKTVFEMKGHNSTPTAENPVSEPSGGLGGHISAKDWTVLKTMCKEKGVDPEEVLTRYGYSKPSEVTLAMYQDMIAAIAEGQL